MNDVKAAGQQLQRSQWYDRIARIGLVAYGVVHILIGWVALQLAMGDSQRSPDATGALHELASQPFGRILVWTVALGLAALVIWRVLEAAFGHQKHDGSDRIKKQVVSLGKALLYGAMALTAFRVALPGGSSKGGKSWSGKLMDLPAGQWLVAAIGLAVIGYGCYTAWRGWSEKFMEHVGYGNPTLVKHVGKAGYLAKGLSIAIVGALLTWAGVAHAPGKGNGLDDALMTLLEQPFGSWLLGLVALGLAGYGVFSLIRAWQFEE